MRKTALTGAALITLVFALAGCSGMSDSGKTSEPDAGSSSSTSSESTSMERMGDFAGMNDKKVMGKVTVDDAMIALSDFSSDEGPDLHVYLTNGTDEADIAAGMQIDAVAFDNASQTFMLDGVTVGDYSTVVIYCNKAKAVFGAADLS